MQGDGFWQGCGEIVQCGWECRVVHIYVENINVSQKMETRTTRERAVPFRVIFQKDWNQHLEGISAFLCSVLQCSRLPGCGNNPTAHRQVSEQRDRCLRTQWDTIYPFRKGEFCSQTFMSIVCFAHLIQDSTLYLVAWAASAHATNSDKFSFHFYCYKCLQIFLVMAF